METGERRLLALLSADVVGYSRLIAADEEATIARLAGHRDAIGRVVVANNGRLVDFVGDNFLAEFGSALHAVRCATEIQYALHEKNADVAHDQRMEFRIGAHVGDVRIEGDRLYGEAINIAARLEGLAEAGGLCLSQQVVDQLGQHVNLPLDDLGEQTLKNIARPVRAYGVAAQALVARPAIPGATAGGADGGDGVHGGGMPVIAVLPFSNLSRDAETAELVDGMTVDIITSLSCDKRFSVVSYGSVTEYAQSDASAVGRELGARYVVEGAVRRLGEKLRVSVALIDTDTRREVWSEKIDREMTDLFAVFDEIVEAIVTSLGRYLTIAEDERFRRKRPEQLDAWALAIRASNYTNNSMALNEALELVDRALEVDPQYAFAWAVKAYLTALRYPLGFSTDHAADIETSMSAATKALHLDNQDPYALTAQAVGLQYAGRARESLEFLHRSLRLNPSDTLTHCYYGRALIFTGSPELALAHFERFNQLNLNAGGGLIAGMYHAIALVLLQRWEDAVRVARQASVAAGGRNPWTLVMLATALTALGEPAEATAALRQVGEISPHWDRRFVEDFFTQCQEDPSLLPPMFEALAQAWAPLEQAAG